MSSSPSASSDSEGSRRKRQRRDRRTRDEEERPSKRQDRGRWGEGTESPDPERNARDREKEYGRVDRSGRDGERRGDDRRRGDDVRSSGRRRGERSDDDRRARRREEEEYDRRRRRRHERDEEDRRRERRRDDGRRDDRERREPERRERDDGRRRDSDDTGRSRGRDREERARYGNERGGDRRERDDGKIRRGRGHLDRGRTITAEKASGKEAENGRGPAEGEVGAGPASAASKDAAGGKSEKAGRTGGVYIPPFKLAQMMQQVDDKGSEQYQRMTWDALRKSINGLINKVNSANLRNILPELFSENLLRGKGLFARSLMKSQMASPGFTPVYAAMLAVVNTKFPELGELFIHRIVLAFKRAFKRNDRGVLMSAVKMIAHLTNQGVLHEMLALEVLMLLLDTPTDDSVEVAVEFTKEVGAFLQEESPQALNSVFERFRAILHEGEIDKRVQFMIEGLFAVRKASFAKSGHPAVPEDLDLVEEEDQITHEVSLEDALDGQPTLDVFKQDAEYEQNEAKYAAVKRELLGEESEDEDDEEGGEKEGGGEDDSDDDDDDDDDEDTRVQIEDRTDTNVVTLRRTIYLTIMSSMDFEECGHKLMKIPMAPGQEIELATMLVECCSQERTYLRYYGLLSQRFCYLKRAFQECFEDLFSTQYQYVHRLETNKVRNLAKLFAHLLGTDAISWQVLADIVLTENTTTSASRIFIKYLFQELSENLGLVQLNSRLLDPDCAQWFRGIFPKDNTINMRFCINFFTAIGLGGLTDQMRADLLAIMEEQKKRRLEEAARAAQAPASSSSSSSSESDSSSDSESGSDTTSSSGSEDESNGSDSD